MDKSSAPPKVAIKLLDVFVPSELREVLIGDLNEEFRRRTQQPQSDANIWFWRQTIMTTTHYLSHYLASEDLLRKLVWLVTALLFPTLLISVLWLSNVDEPSEYIWNNLLDGKMHMVVMTSEFWEVGSDTVINHFGLDDIDMYINFPSVIWALLTFTVLFLRNKQASFSAHQAAAWGTILMFMPYMFGLVFIEVSEPVARQVGPIIAIMLISIIYIILPLAWFVNSKINYQADS